MNEIQFNIFTFDVSGKRLYRIVDGSMKDHIQDFIYLSLDSENDDEIEIIKREITYDYHVNKVMDVIKEKFDDVFTSTNFLQSNYVIHTHLSEVHDQIKPYIEKSRRSRKLKKIINE